MQVEFIESLLTHEKFENMWFSDLRLDSRLPAEVGAVKSTL